MYIIEHGRHDMITQLVTSLAVLLPPPNWLQDSTLFCVFERHRKFGRELRRVAVVQTHGASSARQSHMAGHSIQSLQVYREDEQC
jgi:hypothetical protein